MADKIALKRLSGSDLSFFDFHFRHKTFGDHRQKGINLNEDVFVDQFYPQAKNQLHTRWEVLLTIFGPGSAPAYSPPGDHRRPITYNNGKNWRLNGGTIPDDPRDLKRFQPLAPGDLTLIRFRGEAAPSEADVFLISRQLDGAIHQRLDALVSTGRRTMISVDQGQIGDVFKTANLTADHPVLDLFPVPEVEAALEDIALGGSVTAITLTRKRGGRRLTPEELAQAREKVQRLGFEGEEAANSWLLSMQEDGNIGSLDWISQRDAAAPFDFQFLEKSGQAVKMDIKSTAGSFENQIHISLGEMLEAAQTPERYDLARVYSLQDGTIRIRVAQGINQFARDLLQNIVLPEGIRIDGFSLNPNLLKWGGEIVIDRDKD